MKAHSAPTDPLVQLRGPLCGGEGREGKVEKGRAISPNKTGA